ncbi:uncharacterized protein VICG_02038 [Vittaforma corneae ATCC 50505]|uniref:Transcription initiation factor IIF subunit beta n=1 Tax=Vittaforma corneae (strain ATCC 50505) TaxID=993615 RepID=L2GJY5_VITCO|nr:uncharacterized protein VICG_02038 [Vittaforma corneae ATCC 50505]ELA40949.1 hypothetical protein VICG_02038 [Vittaforma corneae ATCC 50505]
MRLNSEKKKLSVWLTKVPKYLGEQILKLRKGSVVGTLSVGRSSPAETPALQIKLSNALLDTGIPTEHIIEIKDKGKCMYLASHCRDNAELNEETMDVEGIINKECFIRPVLNSEYLQYKRRMKNAEESTEEKVKVIDYFAEVKRSAKYSTLKEMDILARKRKQMLQDKKRERLEKTDVMEIVFNAFEKHKRWTVRDLADFSGQPVAYIQEIVNEICVLNKKDHKNTYELKPEYKYH